MAWVALWPKQPSPWKLTIIPLIDDEVIVIGVAEPMPATKPDRGPVDIITGMVEVVDLDDVDTSRDRRRQVCTAACQFPAAGTIWPFDSQRQGKALGDLPGAAVSVPDTR